MTLACHGLSENCNAVICME